MKCPMLLALREIIPMSNVNSTGIGTLTTAVDSTSATEKSHCNETRRQVSRFIVIGLLSVAIDGLVYSILAAMGVSAHLAKGVSYCSGMLFGFAGNKVWTFESRLKSLAEPTTYAAIYAVTLAVNVSINALVLWVGRLLAPESAARLLAFLTATGVTTVLNFLGMRLITFRTAIVLRRETEQSPTAAPPDAIESNPRWN
jgi:putative flippase GtrA